MAPRVGHRVLLILGGIVFGLGFLLRWAVTSGAPHYLSQWLPVVLTTGIGVGLLMPTLASAAVHGLPSHRLGVGSAVNQAIRQIGFVLGVSITIAVAGNAHGSDALVAFRPMFLLLAIGGFMTAVLSLPIDTQSDQSQAEISPRRAGLSTAASSSALGVKQ